MNPIHFVIIGGAGWRADFFLKIAQELPQRFRVSGLVVRDAEKGRLQELACGVPTFRTLDDLLAAQGKPDFAIVSVPWPVAPGYLVDCSERGVPVLCETPPAPDLAGLADLQKLAQQEAKIQIAEQYPFQPLHAARIKIAESGRLGTVSQVQISVAHGYHGVVLMRRLLNVGFEAVTIRARRFVSPLVAGPDRKGPPTEERVTNESQLLAQFDFASGKLGLFDFTGAQYFSYIRGPRLLVRGERGEIEGETVRWLHDFRTPMTVRLERQDKGQRGNLDGYYHWGITAGAKWVYENPFIPARLFDDEIAIATCLQKMAEYVAGGPSFYGLGEAAHDHYLNLLMEQAAKSGEAVSSTPQWWME